MQPQRTSPSPVSFRLTPLVALIAAFFAPAAHATSFVITDGETFTTRQRLYDNETGVIQAGGYLSTSTTAIVASGTNNTITNDGLISTIGDIKAGIASTGSNATVTNSGTISTLGSDAYGIYSTGSNASVTNRGTISTAGVNAPGIYSTGINTTFINSGTISTTGAYAFAIDSTGSNTTLTSSGSVITKGYQAYGINSIGLATILTNSGSISTAGDGAYGIYSGSVNGILTNSGSISTAGVQAHGIVSADAILINSGSISTTGDSAYGIYSTGAAITNSGSIATKGSYAYGLFSSASNASIANSGSISITGTGAIGIYSIGSGTNTINVSGSVSATGSATQAIVGGAGNEILNLLPGARIIGTVDLGSGTNVINVTANGAGPSATMTITNAGTISSTNGNALSFVHGSTVHFVDTTNLTATQASLGTLSSRIAQGLNQQLMSTPTLPKPVKVASAGSDAGLWANDTQPVAWGRAFGSNTTQASHDAALGFNERSYGALGGYEQNIGEHRAGFFAGIAQGKVNVDSNSADVDSSSLFAGTYGQYVHDNWRFNGALALGYAGYSSTRQVIDNLYGVEKAAADYHAWYLSPSLAATYIVERGEGFSWRPAAEVNYTYARLSSYDETGSTRSNLSVGSRTANVLNTRLQLAAHQAFLDKQGEVALRGGVSHTTYGDKTTAIALQGVGATRYSLSGAGDLSSAYVGLNLRLHYKDNLSFVGDVEHAQSRDHDHALMAYAGMEYRF